MGPHVSAFHVAGDRAPRGEQDCRPGGFLRGHLPHETGRQVQRLVQALGARPAVATHPAHARQPRADRFSPKDSRGPARESSVTRVAAAATPRVRKSRSHHFVVVDGVRALVRVHVPCARTQQQQRRGHRSNAFCAACPGILSPDATMCAQALCAQIVAQQRQRMRWVLAQPAIACGPGARTPSTAPLPSTAPPPPAARASAVHRAPAFELRPSDQNPSMPFAHNQSPPPRPHHAPATTRSTPYWQKTGHHHPLPTTHRRRPGPRHTGKRCPPTRCGSTRPPCTCAG